MLGNQFFFWGGGEAGEEKLLWSLVTEIKLPTDQLFH